MKKYIAVFALVAALFVFGVKGVKAQECQSPESVIPTFLVQQFMPATMFQAAEAAKFIQAVFEMLGQTDPVPELDLVVVFEAPDGRYLILGFEKGCLNGGGYVNADQLAYLLTVAFGKPL